MASILNFKSPTNNTAKLMWSGTSDDTIDLATINTTAKTVAAFNNFTITSGELTTTNELSAQDATMTASNNWSNNFVDVFPPTGFIMSNLAGFMCSPAVIEYDGTVDSNDTLYCRYQIQTDHVRIICQDSENRAVSKVNYLAMWKK